MIKKSVEDRVDYYKKKRELISSGKYKPMPFVGFPSLTNYVAGIIPGIMYKVTSHSGINLKKNLMCLFFLYINYMFEV